MKILILGTNRKILSSILKGIADKFDIESDEKHDWTIVTSAKLTKTEWSKSSLHLQKILLDQEVLSSEDLNNKYVMFDNVPNCHLFNKPEIKDFIIGSDKIEHCLITSTSSKTYLSGEIIDAMDLILITKSSQIKQVEYWTQFIDPRKCDCKRFKAFMKLLPQDEYYEVDMTLRDILVDDEIKLKVDTLLTNKTSKSKSKQQLSDIKVCDNVPEVCNNLSIVSDDITTIQNVQNGDNPILDSEIWFSIVVNDVKSCDTIKNQLLNKIKVLHFNTLTADLKVKIDKTILTFYFHCYSNVYYAKQHKNAFNLNIDIVDIVRLNICKLAKELKSENKGVILNSFLII
jgi:hypothetical protein